LADLVDDLAHGLRDTTAQLVKAGYEYIQFDEPCILLDTVGKNELELARRALDVCAKGCGAETAVHTYFADAGPVVDVLLESAPDFIGLDFYATSLESILHYDFDKGLGCGCIDGRNSLLESPTELRRFVARVTEKVNPKELFICPNCGLEFLPYPVAEKKVHILSETKRLVA
jgi:5-methyltetrahydropteroyltriglutamate--homocysteine methyltransferase